MTSVARAARIVFVERLVVDGQPCAFGAVLEAMVRRLERETPRRAGPVRVNVVRRMASSEVARLRLEPASGAWFEVCGEIQHVPADQQACGAREACAERPDR